jgi:hypothetical protein
VHPVLLALIATTGVGIHIGETERVPYQDVLGLVETMSGSIRERTVRPVVIDSADWEQCRGRGPCLDAVRARTQTTDVVVVRVFGGPLTLHVATERFYPDVEATRTSSVSLPKNDTASWKRKLDGMVRHLFPDAVQLPPPPATSETVAQPPSEASIAPWIVLGASGAAAAVGIGFAISNSVARNQLEGNLTLDEEHEALSDRARTHGIAAAALLGTAAAGALTALLIYALD